MLAADDKIAITELISRFALYSDFGDWEKLETVFTQDVRTELEGHTIRYLGIPAQVKHAQISAEQTNGKNRHYYFNFFFDDDDGDVAVNYSFLNVNADEHPTHAKIVVSGRHRDVVVKEGDQWKISRRLVMFDQTVRLDF